MKGRLLAFREHRQELAELQENVKIALQNEMVTRKRFDDFIGRSFWARLTWLFTGK